MRKNKSDWIKLKNKDFNYSNKILLTKMNYNKFCFYPLIYTFTYV